jgi:hypothetical protein
MHGKRYLEPNPSPGEDESCAVIVVLEGQAPVEEGSASQIATICW